MPILIRRTSLDAFFAAGRVVLCEKSLVPLFRKTITTTARLVPFEGEVIGEGNDREIIPLDEVGLPTAIDAVVAPADLPFVRAFRELIQRLAFPRRIPILLLDAEKGISAGGRLKAGIARILEQRLDEFQATAIEREREIVELRRLLEVETLRSNHLSDFLDMLGYARQELALEGIPDLTTDFVGGELFQALPVVLSDLAGLSIYAARSEREDVARLSLLVAGKVVAAEEISLKTSGGWNDLFFPSGFLRNHEDAVLAIEPLDGDPRFALAQGSCEPAIALSSFNGRCLALRIWRHCDARTQVLREESLIFLPKPRDPSKGRLLETESSARGELAVTSAGGVFVTMRTLPDRAVDYTIGDLDLGNVERIEISVSAALQRGKETPVAVALYPAANAEKARARLAALASGSPARNSMMLERAKIRPMKAVRMALPTAGLDTSIRYRLSLLALPDDASGGGLVYWRNVALVLRSKPHRLTYRFSHFASLYSQIAFADGPFRESEINRKSGFAVVAISDGDRFLQTHPLLERIVAVRLDAFVPAGLQRLWIEIGNDHEAASPTEFGILITPEIVDRDFTEFFAGEGYAELGDDQTHALPDGRILKKMMLRGGEQATLDLFFAAPLARGGHLYLYVRNRSESVQFGWCRWHRVAMTILAGDAPPPEESAAAEPRNVSISEAAEGGESRRSRSPQENGSGRRQV
jgi:hypothetical protein